jgi:hypothetical protein
MQTRINYYVRTTTGGYIKLGTLVTTKDCRVPGVVEEVGRLLGLDGWNCYEVNGKMAFDGPGIPSESVYEFAVSHTGQVMSLRYDDSIDVSKFVVPKIGGYKYVAPVVEDEVVEVDEAGVAPSESVGVLKEPDYSKMKKAELLELLGDDGDGRLSKAELVELIVNKLKK